MSSSGRTIDEELCNSGVAMVGEIDPTLIENLTRALPGIQQRQIRQTELKWNGDCDAIVSDFETRLKPNIATLGAKICLNHRFVFFHEYPTASGILKPEHGAGKHTVAIVIREGPGLPLIYKGSHKSNELDMSKLDPPSTISLGSVVFDVSSSGVGSVVVFDASIGREDPVVKGVGGAGIFLLYREVGEGNRGT